MKRYSNLFRLPDKLYTQGSPILIAAGALLKDNQTGNILAQIKFCSLSNKGIKAVKVRIRAFDVVGAEIQGISEYQYLDLSAPRNAEFGQKTAIPLPNPITRSFSVACTSVIFSDNSAWEAEENAVWEPLPKQQNLENLIGNLAQQYRRDTSIQSHLEPLEYSDLWICSCGTLNKRGESQCCSCGVSRNTIFSALDTEALVQGQSRFNKEKADLQKLREEQSKKKIVQIKKFVAIGSLCAAIIVICIILFNLVLLPLYSHNQLNSFSKTLQQGLESRDLLVSSSKQKGTDDTIEEYREYVSAESKIFSFSDVDFSDDEINKYANMYIEGLGKQKKALDYDITSNEFITLWNDGYGERSNAVLYFQKANLINLDKDLYATFAIKTLCDKIVQQGQLTVAGEYATIVVNNDTLMDFQDVKLDVYWGNEVTSTSIDKWAAGQDAYFEIPIPKSVLDSIDLVHEVSVDIPSYIPGTLYSETSVNSKPESENPPE